MVDPPSRRPPRSHAGDLRSAVRLVASATRGVTSVVEEVHTAIGAFPIVTKLVYQAIRNVTGLVGASLDGIVDGLTPLLGESVAGPEREIMVAALNGVLGDRLLEEGSPLAIPMTLHPPPTELTPGARLVLLVHGSSMCDLQWTRDGHDHGKSLAADLGRTAVYAHYNSGRHISTNGAELAALLEPEVAEASELVIIGHSMGGLVARSAIHAAEVAGYAWRKKLRVLVTIGSPHHGAPLERSGNVLETLFGITPFTAPLRSLSEIRSAGVTDLRFGNVADADWAERERFEHGPDPRTPLPLPAGVRCFAIAGTTAAAAGAALPGDGLVPVDSALGRHVEAGRRLEFEEGRIVYGTNHLDLLSSTEVYGHLTEWLK